MPWAVLRGGRGPLPEVYRRPAEDQGMGINHLVTYFAVSHGSPEAGQQRFYRDLQSLYLKGSALGHLYRFQVS